MSEFSRSASGGVAGDQSPWTKFALATSGAAVLVAGCSAPEQAPEMTTTPAPTPAQEAVCSPTDTPKSAEQYLCAKRLTGFLDIVVAADLPTKFTPSLDYGTPANVESFGTYVTTNLAKATGGLITLTPHIISMSAAAKAEVKRRNPDGCIESENKAQAKNLGAVVHDIMPETRGATQVIVLGGESCPSPNGGEVGGVARYEASARYSEVYSINPRGNMIEMAGHTPLATAGSRGIHEILHNFGFNHAGQITPRKRPQTDLSKSSGDVTPLELMREQYSFDEYGMWGNAMSNVSCPIAPGSECTPENLLDAIQRDFLVDGTTPDYKVADEVSEVNRIYINRSEQLTVEEGGRKKGISFPIPADDESYTQIDEYRFNRINFLPNLKHKTVSITLSNDGHITGEISTADLISYQLADGKPQKFMIGSRELTITFREGKAEISAA